jgi:chromosome segregation protein
VLLKTLSIAGFKSFADRTRLDFDQGVNVVVGPNGSGKSNLLDALAWVMGTQATSTLRTQKMEDVIFAGTATRPALGRAEVTLTFDNTDRFLPIELDEVAMTRRLYRDGTSEYELNGTPCRLLDLSELLSDGGVGRHQHVLVGQGQIGEILNARPDEHRAVIEEAAGITKHRARRDRSVRRLEHTDVDVARLIELLEEQRRRLRPLKRQANAAARYDGVKADARALRLWLGGEVIRDLRTRMGEATAEQSQLADALAADRAELEAIEVGLDPLRRAAGDVGRALERDTGAAARLETVAERFRRIGLVARERRIGMESRVLGAGERRGDLEAEYVDLQAEIEATKRDEAAALLTAERAEVLLTALEDESRSLSEQAQLPADGVVANLRGDLSALEAAADRDRHESEAVSRRIEAVTVTLEREATQAADLIAEIQQVDIAVGEAQGRYAGVKHDREAAQETWEAAEHDSRAAEVAIAAASARLEAVEGALAGIGDPAARSLAAESRHTRDSLVALLDVPADIAPAVDTALGAWQAAFVVAGDDGLEQLVTELKKRGLGGVGFVTRQPAAEVPAATVAAAWGVEALVERLGPEADRRLAEQLLGDVVLVEGWSTGRAIVAKHPEIVAATPEGDLITASAMRVAEPDGVGPAALEAARVAIEIADRDQARAESRRGSTHRDFDTTRAREREALEALEALEARLAGHTEALAVVERTRNEAEAEIERLHDRQESLDEAAAVRTDRLSDLRARLAQFEGEEKARQEAWEALARQRESVAGRRETARRARETAAGDLAGIVERRRLSEARLGANRREVGKLVDRPSDPADIEALHTLEAHARRAETVTRDHVAALRERQRDLRERSTAADRDLANAQARREELHATTSEAKDRASALAVELAELRVRHESVAEALRREADATEEQALDADRPEIADDEDAEAMLASLEAQLRRMGPINPLAAAEYEELAAAAEELEAQLSDLEVSRQELRKVIAALDEEMAALFRTAFDDIAAMYEENFRLVFPGGRGRLRLTDPERPLETGVELEAQPLGKKVDRLSLLSGGERSLAALAFLIAVFRARPSPFYVLDEVEAALDDANLRRFLRLVANLRETSQVVIITHQQHTMEAADILYGVTMEPGESSVVIAKKFDRVTV